MLRVAIIEKTGFVFNIRKKSVNKRGEQTYRMCLYRKQTEEFLEAIAPYTQPSFYYKLATKRAPQAGDDIVCSVQECAEAGGNNPPSLNE